MKQISSRYHSTFILVPPDLFELVTSILVPPSWLLAPQSLKLVNKCISGNCPQFFKQYFNFNNTRTRQRNLLHLPHVRTETAKKSFYYHGCVVYNSQVY